MFKRINPENIFIKGEQIDLQKHYTLSVRQYIYEGYDGYDELPNCANLDKTDDLGTIFDICLKYFELVKSLPADYFTNENYPLDDGIFGYDMTSFGIKNFLKESVVFNDSTPEVSINSSPRIYTVN